MSMYDGFLDEFCKSAFKQTFMRGAKQSIPWTLGFEALESATKPPHLSLETSREKTKRLAKNMASGAVGFGTWDVISKALKSKKAPESLKKIYNKAYKKGGKRAANKVMMHKLLLGGGRIHSILPLPPREPLRKLYSQAYKKGGKSAARKSVAKAILKRFPRGAAVLGASLGGSMLAEDLIGKLFGSKTPKEYPLQYLRRK